jgi:hypothetical protein
MSALLFVLLAGCAPAADGVLPAATRSGTPPDGVETAPPPGTTGATFDPETFTISGVFAYDPAVDAIVSWTFLTPDAPHLSFTFTDPASVTCVAVMGFATSGPTAPQLATWDFADTVWGGFFRVEEVLEHQGFVAVPTSITTDCPPLDAAEWGTTDVGDLLLGWEWGVGFGPVRSDHADEATDTFFGGSIAGDLVASGSPPVDAVAWATATELDETYAVRTDIGGMPILYTPGEVLDAAAPPRALYRIEAAVDWYATSLLP